MERLQLDYIDVLQCYRFDKDTPVAGTMRAMDDVVKTGYARYIGMSSCYVYQFHKMQNYAISNNLTPFISMKNYHNVFYREEEREMMPTLKVGVPFYLRRSVCFNYAGNCRCLSRHDSLVSPGYWTPGPSGRRSEHTSVSNIYACCTSTCF